MNTQKSLILFASIFALTILLAGLGASALTALSLTPESQDVVYFTDSTTTLNVAYENATLDTITLTEVTDFGLDLPSPLVVNGTNSTAVTLEINSISIDKLTFGDNIVEINASGNGYSDTATINVQRPFCDSGINEDNNLTIDNVDIKNNGDGDDTDWELLDEIEVEIDVKNDNQDDRLDALVVLGLFDESGKDVADDLTYLPESDSDDEEIKVRVDEDDEATVTYVFRIPADFDIENYKLVVKVYDDDETESETCSDTTEDYEDITVKEKQDEEDYIAIDDFTLPSEVACGEFASGSFTLFNVGEDDQDRVKVTVRNDELGLNEVFEITSSFDIGDEEEFDISFRIPNNIEAKTYVLEFIPEFDYRRGIYTERGTFFSLPLTVFGGCTSGNDDGNVNAQVSADLDSDAVAGQELVVLATITNTGSERTSFVLSATDYDSWADSASISDRTLTLDSGESETIEVKLDVRNDASGRQSFFLEVIEGSNSERVEIEANIESSGFGGFDFTNSGLIWVIGAINLILIILIIVVAVRLSRR